MKIAILISALAIGGNLLTNPISSSTETTSVHNYTLGKRKKSAAMPTAPIKMVVDKSNYELYVYDAHGWYATYPVVFGNKNLDDKRMEGDKNTPEGEYRIVNKRVHDKWSRYMGLNYPTPADLEKFQQRKRRGEVPAGATPGGGIGIHGTWPHEDFVVDRFNNWTNGCISLKRSDVEELYGYIQLGTSISIRK